MRKSKQEKPQPSESPLSPIPKEIKGSLERKAQVLNLVVMNALKKALPELSGQKATLNLEKLSKETAKQANEDTAILMHYYGPDVFSHPLMGFGLSMGACVLETLERIPETDGKTSNNTDSKAGVRKDVPGSNDAVKGA